MSNLGHVKLRLVHAYQTDYVEEGAHFDHVWRFADKGDGYMEEIHGLRDKYRADVAVLIVDDPKGCGLATRVFADADEAFAVVHHECAAATYSVAHEIGHIIGARHDLNLDKIMTPFPYGHGYVNGTKWRDIMSYKESCGGCPRLPVWSSPKVMVKGEPAGTPDLDNARVIASRPHAWPPSGSRASIGAGLPLPPTSPSRHLVEDLRELDRARLLDVDLHAVVERLQQLGRGLLAHDGVAVVAALAEEVRRRHVLGDRRHHLEPGAGAGEVHELDLGPREGLAPGGGGIVLEAPELEHLQPGTHVGVEVEGVDAEAGRRAANRT